MLGLWLCWHDLRIISLLNRSSNFFFHRFLFRLLRFRFNFEMNELLILNIVFLLFRRTTLNYDSFFALFFLFLQSQIPPNFSLYASLFLSFLFLSHFNFMLSFSLQTFSLLLFLFVPLFELLSSHTFLFSFFIDFVVHPFFFLL